MKKNRLNIKLSNVNDRVSNINDLVPNLSDRVNNLEKKNHLDLTTQIKVIVEPNLYDRVPNILCARLVN